MNRLFAAMLAVACLCVAGCGQKVEPDKEKDTSEGLNIKLPGVEVKVNDEEGVSVEAPGTNVKVNKEGVDVKAPGTDVKVNPDGVKVETPE